VVEILENNLPLPGKYDKLFQYYQEYGGNEVFGVCIQTFDDDNNGCLININKKTNFIKIAVTLYLTPLYNNYYTQTRDYNEAILN
jgi:hypothetical protein